ncbi:hypothetical protein ACFQZS_08370 [Mucilaginibacter calamicampi]|uniref:HEAT repeat domain-containing protein n=1 Tax=Mucilaginibacter calamicampi TaxID=1302352 RepID=A0ABW2YUX1_9SPHI
MDKTELIKQISSNIGKVKVLGLSKILHERNFDLRDLIAVTFHNNKDVAFRATWLLENVFLDNPEVYLPELEFLLSGITKVKHPGPQRHYAKIIMHITDSSAPQIIKDKVQQLNMEPAVEQLFEWMIEPKVKIAVKAFAAEALFNMKDRYPWIKDELAQQLQFLMRDGTAAIQSKGRKILHQLQ